MVQKLKNFEEKLMRFQFIFFFFFVFQINKKFNYQAAEQYIYDQTLTIQNENVQLRKRLQEVLKRTEGLNDLKQRLEEEQLHLIRRLKLVADLRKIRLDKISSDVTNPSQKSALHLSN